MSAITEISAAEYKPVVARSPGVKTWGSAVGVTVAALLLVAMTCFLYFRPNGNGHVGISSFSLLAQARAAEEKLFAGDGVVHLVNEIIVKPVSDPDWARMRWFPLVSLQATGKPRFDQLTLSAKVGQGYTVADQCWYEPATGRFARLLTVDDKPIFAHSYDGKAVCSLEANKEGGRRVVKRPVGEDFRPPKNAAELLGIAAGLHSGLDEKDESLVQDTGEVTLDDGSKGRMLKAGFPRGGPKEQEDVYWLFTIREDNHRIAQMEFRAKGQSLLVVRRVKAETVQNPALAWDLAGIETQTGDAPQQPTAGIMRNIVIPNVSEQHMVKKADFQTYVFAKAPPWAAERRITDILDIVSPPQRMFAITYRAQDGRHVVLIQSHSYNKLLGPMVKKMGKSVYESPKGVKVWSGPRDKWLAGILLQSARAVIKDSPSEDRTGYLLETPAGTFPALAVNGQVTEEELHSLIDSLVPVKRSSEDSGR